MKIKTTLLAAFGLSAAFVCPIALAQERHMDTIVVTATAINSSADKPAITKKIRANEVLFEGDIMSASRNPNKRRRDVEQTFSNMRKVVGSQKGVTLYGGSFETLYPIDSVAFSELYSVYGERGSVNFVIALDVGDDDAFPDIRRRAEKFLKSFKWEGRAEPDFDDEQSLRVQNLKAHRNELVRDIAADVQEIRKLFAPVQIEIEQIDRKPSVYAAGALEVELVIPYTISLLPDYQTRMKVQCPDDEC